MSVHNNFLSPMPRVVAHRGDSFNFPENTLPAFLSAVQMGIDVIETDVHLSKDGVLVVWHDPTLERNTDGKGRIEDHTLAQLKTYDAGYTFSKDHGKTFPSRGKGIQLCTLEEALMSCPQQRFNVDLKSKEKAIVDEFIRVVHTCHASERVCGASFHLKNLQALRRKEPALLTSVTTVEVIPLLLKQKLHLLPKNIGKKRRIIFQIPTNQWGIQIITPSFIRMMHERGCVIMVWTINDESEMRKLFTMGVDSIMTDNPRKVIEVAKSLHLR